MRKIYTYTLLAFSATAQLQAQGNVTIEFDNSTLVLPATAVDLMQSDTVLQRVDLSYGSGNQSIVTSDTLAPEAVNLANEKAQSFNVLNSFSLKKNDNPGVREDITVELGAQKTALIVLPYLASVNSLTPSFQTTGAHIFINGKLWQSGSKVDFSEPAQIKVVSFNGDVRTYSVTVSRTSLPYVVLNTDGKGIEKEWTPAKLTIDGNDEGTLNIKGKGSHFGAGLKNNYALKFESKKSLLGITKNKRWLLVANEADKLLIRSQLGYWLGKQLTNDQWIPEIRPVNLTIDGAFAGCYTLVEQPRICKGRFEDGYLLSVEKSADAFEEAFRTKGTKTIMAFEDPETGSKGTGLVRTKDKIDKFEKALEKGDWTTVQQVANLESMANWLVISEIAYNTDAFSEDTYIHVDANGKIAFMPAWELRKAFAAESNGYTGWVAAETPWMSMLMKNNDFVSLVKKQYAKIRSSKNELYSYIDQQTKILREAGIGDNTVWKNLSNDAYGNAAAAYDAETERLKNWLESRMNWLDTQW